MVDTSLDMKRYAAARITPGALRGRRAKALRDNGIITVSHSFDDFIKNWITSSKYFEVVPTHMEHSKITAGRVYWPYQLPEPKQHSEEDLARLKRWGGPNLKTGDTGKDPAVWGVASAIVWESKLEKGWRKP